MLLGGDEMGRSQQGNNNAYCQDNEITWFDWSKQDSDLLGFTKRLVDLRRSHPVFRRRRYLAGAEAAEVGWFTPAGTAMTGSDWAANSSLALAIYLDGSDDPDRSMMARFWSTTTSWSWSTRGGSPSASLFPPPERHSRGRPA